MTNVTLKGLPQGTAELHYAARVEAHRQGLLPRPAPLSSKPVEDGTLGTTWGQVTFDLTPRIEYVIFGSDGKGRSVMYAVSSEITSLSPSSIVHAVATTLRVLGSGFSLSARVRVAGVVKPTKYVSPAELQVIGLSVAAAGTVAVDVDNAGQRTNAVNLTVT